MNISLEYVDYTSLSKDEQDKIIATQKNLITHLKIAIKIKNKPPEQDKKIHFLYDENYIPCLVANNMQLKCTSSDINITDNTPEELEALANLLMSMHRLSSSHVVTGPLTTHITITTPPIQSFSRHTDDHHLPNLTERSTLSNLTNITVLDGPVPPTTVICKNLRNRRQPSNTHKNNLLKSNLLMQKLIDLSLNSTDYNQIIQLADKAKISLTNSINSNTNSKQAASLQSETESFKSQIENITSFIDAIKKIQESILKMSGPTINLNETGISAQVSSLMDKYILPAIEAKETTRDVQVIKKTLRTLELSDFYEHNSVSTNETQRLFQQATDDLKESQTTLDTTHNKNHP